MPHSESHFDAPHDPDDGPVALRTSTSRRGFARFLFAVGLGGVVLGAGKLFSDFLTPTGPYAAALRVGSTGDFVRGGAPVHFEIKDANGLLRRLQIVHLDPADAARNGSDGGNGILAMDAQCAHLQCTLRWNPGFDFEGQQGWFRCACHGSTYTRAGVRIFGPAPRSLTTFRVHITSIGEVIVDATNGELGDRTNPSRAVPVPPRFLA